MCMSIGAYTVPWNSVNLYCVTSAVACKGEWKGGGGGEGLLINYYSIIFIIDLII